MPTTTTTTTTTTTRRLINVPKPKPRLIQRKRKIVIRTRTSSVKGAKATVRQAAKTVAALPVKRAEVISVTTTRPRTRALPAPTTTVSELTVKERQRLPAPRR